jgi:anti-sigma factor RsiW
MADRTDRCNAPQTPSLRLAIGAYALGALGQAETDQVTMHLAHCPSCHTVCASTGRGSKSLRAVLDSVYGCAVDCRAQLVPFQPSASDS